MKKGCMFVALLLIFFIGIISAECSINVSMINQDPYPAIPGESVKVIFQVNGISDPDCKTVEFGVKENFPFTIDPESENPIIINSGIYAERYSSFYIAPYKIRIDSDALDGNNPIQVYYSSTSTTYTGQRLKDFNIYVENTLADFEIFVKDYNLNTNVLTLEILNIEDVDVQALAIAIPKQDNIDIKGADRVVVGDLDSNEYTTADFEAIARTGKITLQILYTDSADIRREITKTINFDSDYFNGRKNGSSSAWIYITILIIIIAFVGWRIYRRRKIKRKLYHR
ncbi:hypothetical protein M0R19_01605 [Candidatus Pacearchaeota archaeon]|nr:hypothetical protein [Candidatus Pacearchaeota archaeon]